MIKVMDLAEFLLFRIAEDEEVARGVASPGPWVAVRADLSDGQKDAADVARVEGGDEYSPAWVALDTDGTGSTELADAEHIARWDPARVLAECEAKRRIVEKSRRAVERRETAMTPVLFGRDQALDAVLELLALPYAGHPDYDEKWRP